MPVKPTSSHELHTGVPSTKSLIQFLEREVAGDVRMSSQRIQGRSHCGCCPLHHLPLPLPVH
eukprot:13065950-Heterocapsa_arctica.AAC.1